MNTKSIKVKMNSIKGIKKITKTMEIVSVTKMKKTTARALLGRPYETKARSLLEMLPGSTYKHPYYTEKREFSKILVILIGSDKGLCGGYNAQIYRKLLDYKRSRAEVGRVLEVYTIGKTANMIARKVGLTINASFGTLSDPIDLSDISTIARMVTQKYKNDAEVGKVVVLSQAVESGITIKPIQSILLPFNYQREKRNPEIDKIKIEPHPLRFLEVVVPGLIESLIIHALLEARAAEHTARMVAMKNATDNADEFYKDLQRTYNKSRQAAITQEIAEIVGGAASLELS